jgi:hypothetical protein
MRHGEPLGKPYFLRLQLCGAERKFLHMHEDIVRLRSGESA